MTAPARGVTEPEGDRMSKTDKTRPWWVRMADAPGMTSVPVHDHRFGPCTLPEEITVSSASLSYYNAPTSGCYWRATDYYIFDCGGSGGGREWYYFRREARRRSRYQARRELRAYDGED
jgi:hypothetical protein